MNTFTEKQILERYKKICPSSWDVNFIFENGLYYITNHDKDCIYDVIPKKITDGETNIDIRGVILDVLLSVGEKPIFHDAINEKMWVKKMELYREEL